MATPSPIIQIVGHENETTYFNEGTLRNTIVANCKEKKAPYPVFSIIGAQSSGKSTLLNAMFNTDFQMLDPKEGWRATTEGIWAAICNNPRAVVLDVEGSDGAEHQDDTGFENKFENKSGLFALVVSDLIFVNIKEDNIGHNHVGSIPLLHTIFQESLHHEFYKTRIVFVVRDYSGERPQDTLRKQLISTVEKIWKKISPNNKPSLRDRFEEPEVEFLPHKIFCKAEFMKKCTEMRIRIVDNFVGQRNFPVEGFAQLAKKLWADIDGNKRLDMPSYWKLASKERCEVIISGILSSLDTDQGYRSLRNGDLTIKPADFHAKLEKILAAILYEYDHETQYYDMEVAKKIKTTLERQILNYYEPAFRHIMEKYTKAMTEEAANEIKRTCNETLKTKRQARSVVARYIATYEDNAKGLRLYSVQAYQRNFQVNLKLLGDKLASEATEMHIRDILIGTTAGLVIGTVSALSGVLLGAGHLAAGLLGARIAASGPALANVATEESNAAHERNTREIMLRVLEEGNDDDGETGALIPVKGAFSGGSSSSN